MFLISSKNTLPQLESTTNPDQAPLTKQVIPIDAETFKGLRKARSHHLSLTAIDILTLVECKVYFTHEAVSVDNQITLQIALKYDATFTRTIVDLR